MKIEKGQKLVVTVEGTGYGNDNSVLLSIGKYISEQRLEELIETGKLILVDEKDGDKQQCTKELNICPCCHIEKSITEWHFNYEKDIKVCDNCYKAMRICERDLFENGSEEEIFDMFSYIEATRYLK